MFPSSPRIKMTKLIIQESKRRLNFFCCWPYQCMVGPEASVLRLLHRVGDWGRTLWQDESIFWKWQDIVSIRNVRHLPGSYSHRLFPWCVRKGKWEEATLNRRWTRLVEFLCSGWMCGVRGSEMWKARPWASLEGLASRPCRWCGCRWRWKPASPSPGTLAGQFQVWPLIQFLQAAVVCKTCFYLFFQFS